MGGRGGGMMQRSPIRGGTRGRGGGGGMRGAGGTRSYGMGRGYNRYDRKPQEVHIYNYFPKSHLKKKNWSNPVAHLLLKSHSDL